MPETKPNDPGEDPGKGAGTRCFEAQHEIQQGQEQVNEGEATHKRPVAPPADQQQP
jgi:hypothetical protein